MPDGSNFRLPQPEPETVRILKAAKARISDPANWCRYDFARLQSGQLSSLWASQKAVAWCAEGSLHVATSKVEPRACSLAWRSLILAAKNLYGMSPDKVNDKIGHEAVMRMFDRAIELAWQEARETVS